MKLRDALVELRAHRGSVLLALLVASSVVFIACSGSDHTFQDGDDTATPAEDGTSSDVNGDDTQDDTHDVNADDVPSSSG